MRWWSAGESATRQAVLEAVDRCQVQPRTVRAADGKNCRNVRARGFDDEQAELTGQRVRMKDGKRCQAECAQRLWDAGLRASGVNVFDPERVQDAVGGGVGMENPRSSSSGRWAKR